MSPRGIVGSINFDINTLFYKAAVILPKKRCAEAVVEAAEVDNRYRVSVRRPSPTLLAK
jgi:hypothetical protein